MIDDVTKAQADNHSGENAYLNSDAQCSQYLKNFIFAVARCFENNCKIALSTIYHQKTSIVYVLERQCFNPFITHMAQDHKLELFEGKEAIGVISLIIRTTLSLQSLYKGPTSSTFLDTSLKLLQNYNLVKNNTWKFDSETEALSLIHI